MKKLTLLAFSLYSAFSFSQSMMIMNNGKVITIDKAGIANDFGSFMLPYEVKFMGGRYLIDKDRKVRTVDRNGMFFSKADSDKVASDIEYLGENYFISKRGTLYSVDDSGFFYELSKEREYKELTHKGGNFFVSEKKADGKKYKAFFVINSSGQVNEIKMAGLNVDAINYVGGNYFTTAMGELFTVSTDGFVYSKKELGNFTGHMMKRGHKYFFYQSKVFTVSDNGLVNDAGPSLLLGDIKTMGTNFFINAASTVFSVSDTGTIQRVTLKVEVPLISTMSRL